MGEAVRFAVRVAISAAVIAAAGLTARRWPSLAGLIAVMPLTGLVVMLWVYSDSAGDAARMAEYTKGALWGILPSVLFFATALLCFRKHLSLGVVLAISFGVWLLAAAVHQSLLNR